MKFGYFSNLATEICHNPVQCHTALSILAQWAQSYSMMNQSATHNFSRSRTGTSWLLLLLLACLCEWATAQDDLPSLDLQRPMRLDFSGSWEKDFGRSDKWEDELNRMLRIRQEQAARQQAGLGGTGPAVSLGNINLNAGRAGESIFDLARLAEYISRQTTMTIVQDRDEIRIERRGEAPLICSTESGPIATFSSVHGSEVCGWDQQQLVFRLSLPDDLVISHRFSVAADRTQLRMVTSVSSNGSAPFNLIQAFNRYEAPEDGYNCVLTLSRGRVCSQVTPLE